MHQPKTNLAEAPKDRSRGRSRKPQPRTAPSSSPLDALVRGLAAIGDRFVRGRVQLRIP